MTRWKDLSRTMTESAGVGKNFVQFVTKQSPVERSVKSSRRSRSASSRSVRRAGRGLAGAGVGGRT